jgi:hypothetical protein
MAFSDALASSLLGWFKGSPFITAPSTTIYLSLHTGEPGRTGTANDVTTAVAGGRAALPIANLGAIANSSEGGRVTSVEAIVNFTNSALAAANISHVGIWSASSGGTFYAGGALTQSASVLVGDIVRIPVGGLRLRAVGYVA